MNSFISKVVSSILANNIPLENQTIIVPSKRAGALIKNELLKQYTSNSWAPKIITIEELITEISRLRIDSNISLLFKLYKVYYDYKKSKVENKKEPDSFEMFSKWASICIYDFNEIDRYLVDVRVFFQNLRNIKETEQWSPDRESKLVSNYLEFWFDLEDIYRNFNEALLSDGLSYQGMAFRKASELVNQHLDSLSKGEYFNFVGFNALNSAEEKIITTILNRKIGDIYFDLDSYYYENEDQEAGLFARRYFANWSYFGSAEKRWIDSEFTKAKDIEIIGVASNVGQARLAGEIVKQLSIENKISSSNISTAVVMADEKLLQAMLNSLPKEVENLNITMGFPLKLGHLSALFMMIFNLHEKNISNSNHGRFYHREVSLILKNPLIRNILKGENQTAEVILNKIISSNMIYVDVDRYGQLSQNPVLKNIFTSWDDNPSLALNQLSNLLNNLKEFFVENYDKHYVELDQLFRFSQIINQLKGLTSKYPFVNSVKTLRVLFQQILSMESMSFIGEPLKGLQLMGVLETRLMDFENVIITSMNEGILPSSSYSNSFIPFDLRIAMGLPSTKEKDAVFAYHFYRLIQRAKRVFLIYNTEGLDIASGERSRYIKQIEHEAGSFFNIKNSIYTSSEYSLKKPLTELQKNEEYRARLMEYATKRGFSPSSLSNYLYNPLEFYFQKILQLKKEEEVEEVAESTTFGSAIHFALEQIYKPQINKILDKNYLQEKIAEIPELMKQAFNEVYVNGNIEEGKNNLMYNISIEIVKNFLEWEIKRINQGDVVEILSLEDDYSTEVFIEELDQHVLLKGKIDRIEKRNGTICILDYKTGSVENREISLDDFSEILDSEKPMVKMLQVMIYSLFAFKGSSKIRIKDGEKIKAGLISLKKYDISPTFAKIEKSDEITLEILEKFEGVLKSLIWEIFNPEVNISEKESIFKKNSH